MTPFFVLDTQCDVPRKRRRLDYNVLTPRRVKVVLPMLPMRDGSVRVSTVVSPDRWPLVAADAGALGLRQAALQHGASHEAVRQIVRRTDLTG